MKNLLAYVGPASCWWGQRDAATGDAKVKTGDGRWKAIRGISEGKKDLRQDKQRIHIYDVMQTILNIKKNIHRYRVNRN